MKFSLLYATCTCAVALVVGYEVGRHLSRERQPMRVFQSSMWNESNYPWDRVDVYALANASDVLTDLLRSETGSDQALVIIQPNFSGYNVAVWSDAKFDVISTFLATHQRAEMDRSAKKFAELTKPVVMPVSK